MFIIVHFHLGTITRRPCRSAAKPLLSPRKNVEAVCALITPQRPRWTSYINVFHFNLFSCYFSNLCFLHSIVVFGRYCLVGIITCFSGSQNRCSNSSSPNSPCFIQLTKSSFIRNECGEYFWNDDIVVDNTVRLMFWKRPTRKLREAHDSPC